MTRTRGGEADLMASHKEFDDTSSSIVNKMRALVESLERQISAKNGELRDLENELEEAESIKNRELVEFLEKQISAKNEELEDLKKKFEEERVNLEKSIAFHNDRD
ncbi:hypothetical protein ACE5NE_18800 [Clostridioides difficile]